MKEIFKKAVEFVLKWEGEISNHPNDPGGLTIYGIASKYYPQEVQKMYELYKQNKKQEAKEIACKIYYENYWKKIGGDNLPFPLDMIVFDTAVNMGVNTALNLLKQSDNDVYRYLFLRVKKYVELAKNSKLKVFLQGWLNRVIDLENQIHGK